MYYRALIFGCLNTLALHGAAKPSFDLQALMASAVAKLTVLKATIPQAAYGYVAGGAIAGFASNRLLNTATESFSSMAAWTAAGAAAGAYVWRNRDELKLFIARLQLARAMCAELQGTEQALLAGGMSKQELAKLWHSARQEQSPVCASAWLSLVDADNTAACLQQRDAGKQQEADKVARLMGLLPRPNAAARQVAQEEKSDNPLIKEAQKRKVQLPVCPAQVARQQGLLAALSSALHSTSTGAPGGASALVASAPPAAAAAAAAVARPA
jgi:hypothetical protein